jgi:iron complex transport system ATP-binding protein
VPALSARGLAHRVAGRRLFADLDLDALAGRVTAVVGPNGAGKSTLLRVLAGLERPQAGAVRLDDDDLHALAPRDRARRLAYLPQRTSLAYELTVRDLVLLGRAPYLPAFGGPGVADLAAVDAALARVGLVDLAGRSARTLSGGEFQRVMLARMLAGDGRVLVLDEPTAALDIGQALGFLGHLRALADAGAAVVLALHDLGLARRHADAALLLPGDGRALAGPVEQVLSARNLETAFGVAVREVDGHLLFDRA